MKHLGYAEEKGSKRAYQAKNCLVRDAIGRVECTKQNN